MNTESPFKVISPEDLSPEEIKELFVKSYTELNILKNRKHTIIYGSRGNGKSMLLRFLEPKCQILDSAKTTQEFLDSPNSFIGVYIPFKEGYFNKTDLLSIDEQRAYTLSKHLINLHIIGCFIDILESQLKDMINRSREQELSKKIIHLIDTKKLYTIGPAEFTFVKLNEVLHSELSCIGKYLSDCNFPGGTVQYSGNYSDYSTLILPLFKSVGKIIPPLRNASFFLLLDEGDRLYDFQKRYINSMIANRDHKYLSIKLASKIEGYDCFLTDSKTRIQRIHDYETIFLDELYTHSRNTYFNKIKEIANRRLESNELSVDIETFLPPSSYEEKLFDKLKRQVELEWENLPDYKRTKEKANYVDKYATARLFQHLAKKKIQKRYSGFANIVHYSSGIIRNFLHPCHLMFEKVLERNIDLNKDCFIPESLQNQIIYKSSRDFIKELDESIKGLGVHSKEQKAIISNLRRLINALGKLYYERLTDEKSRDPRIISFALTDDPDEQMQNILTYAVKESYFHKVYTVSKSGGGKLECYVLNRALCPAFKLDLSSLRGRILLSSKELWGLIKAPANTSKSILSSERSQADLFDSEIADELYE